MINNSDQELYAIQFPQKRRPLTAEELAATEPFFFPGVGEKAQHGILVIHGFNSTPATVRDIGKSVAGLGYTVSGPRLPGHGTTLADLNRTKWSQWYEAVSAAYDDLSQHCSTISVVGFSLGGALSLQLAAVKTRLQKLFLIAPAVYPIWPLRILKIIARPMHWVQMDYIPRVADLKNSESFEIGYTKMPIDAALEVYACMRATQKILSQVKAPAVIFHSREDHVVSARTIPSLMANLSSDDQEIFWLENSYHVVPRDNDAEFVTRTIMEKLREGVKS